MSNSAMSSNNEEVFNILMTNLPQTEFRIFFFFSFWPFQKQSRLILIGGEILVYQRTNLDAVARVSNHHPAYQPPFFRPAFWSFPVFKTILASEISLA